MFVIHTGITTMYVGDAEYFLEILRCILYDLLIVEKVLPLAGLVHSSILGAISKILNLLCEAQGWKWVFNSFFEHPYKYLDFAVGVNSVYAVVLY